jgi:hypothetical protein
MIMNKTYIIKKLSYEKDSDDPVPVNGMPEFQPGAGVQT